MKPNPYAPTATTPEAEGYFGDFASRAAGTFLYRVIEVEHPFEMTLIYNGWWFRQRVQVNGEIVWSKISWLTIEPAIEFTLPDTVAGEETPGRIEITFSRGLMIRRFRVWIDDQLLYDES